MNLDICQSKTFFDWHGRMNLVPSHPLQVKFYDYNIWFLVSGSSSPAWSKIDEKLKYNAENLSVDINTSKIWCQTQTTTIATVVELTAATHRPVFMTSFEFSSYGATAVAHGIVKWHSSKKGLNLIFWKQKVQVGHAQAFWSPSGRRPGFPWPQMGQMQQWWRQAHLQPRQSGSHDRSSW